MFRLLNRSHGAYPVECHKGIVYIPYNVSIMSLFEHYRAGIPIFCPTVELMNSNLGANGFLNQLKFKGSRLEIKNEWLYLNDWYDEDNMPYILKYGIDNLSYLMKNINFLEISDKMLRYNLLRKKSISENWDKIFEDISNL